MLPVSINQQHQPCPASPALAQNILDQIGRISLPVTKNRVSWSWWYEQIALPHLTGNYSAWKIRFSRYGLSQLKAFIRWHLQPFTLNCLSGLVRGRLKQAFGQ